MLVLRVAPHGTLYESVSISLNGKKIQEYYFYFNYSFHEIIQGILEKQMRRIYSFSWAVEAKLIQPLFLGTGREICGHYCYWYGKAFMYIGLWSC